MLLTARSLRVCVATAAVALTATMGLSACGSDDSSDTAASTSASAVTTSGAAVTTKSSAPAVPGAPTAETLQASLVLLASPTANVDDKVAAVVDGEKRRPNIEAMTKALAGYGELKFTVTDITLAGDTATGTVVIGSPNGDAPPMPLTWQKVGDTWKVSDASTCILLGFAQAPCTT